jgi:RimJ/RimL family protein N-acetyltransferase
MNEVLVVVDMQNDFVAGALGSDAARAVVPFVCEKIRMHREAGRGSVCFTMDTHGEDYLETQEGRKLPVAHCVKGTDGWQLCPEVAAYAGGAQLFEKPAFGSARLAESLAAMHRTQPIDGVTFVGLCTDICVISNAMLLRAFLPETPVCVDALCCAGATPDGHGTALAAMRACQIDTVMETRRLLLRPWRASDAEALYRHASGLDVGPAAGWAAHTSVEDSRDIIQTVLSAPETYAVVRKDTDEPVGSIGLMTRDGRHSAEMGEDEGEIGYWIGKPFWGQGLIPEATEALLRHAFAGLGLSAVWCGYYDGNEQSRRVQEKCGFRYHHTEENKDCPQLGDGERRTEHFTLLRKDEWCME